MCAQKMVVSCQATKMTSFVKYIVFYDSIFGSNLTMYFLVFPTNGAILCCAVSCMPPCHGTLGGAHHHALPKTSTSMFRHFRCLSWNINGVNSAKIADLYAYLAEADHEVDTFVLVDTHCLLTGEVVPHFSTKLAL